MVLDTIVCNLVSTLDAMKTPSASVTPTLPTIGLSATKLALNEQSFSKIVMSLVGERFSLNDGKLAELRTQHTVYFKGNGIYNEESLSIMTNLFDLPSAVNSPRITVPVTMIGYTEFVLENVLHLHNGIQYGELLQWYDAEKLDMTKKENGVFSSKVKSTSSDNRKIPLFILPTFQCDTLKGSGG